MFRDRTSLYFSYRQSYARSSPYAAYANTARRNEDSNPLLGDAADMAPGGGSDVAIEMDTLPPSWTDIDDEVTQILELVKDKSARLDKLHADHVLPGFDDRSQQERVIEQLTGEITQHFHECQRLVKRLEAVSASASTAAQINMSRNMQINLATKVQDASTRFRKKQSAYLKTLRGNRAASLPATNPSAEDDLDVSFSQSQIQQSATVAQSSTDAVIRQREAEITQIAEGIIELAEIFKELQTMVIDQGTLLDRIDYNIENIKVHVTAAATDLKQQRSQKCKIIIFLMLLVFLLLVAVYFKLTGRSSRPSPPAPAPAPAPDPDPSQIKGR